MAGRGMLLKKTDPGRVRTAFGTRDGMVYSALGRSYELAPPSAEQRKKTRAANKRGQGPHRVPKSPPLRDAMPPVSSHFGSFASQAPIGQNPDKGRETGTKHLTGPLDMENMTLGELRVAYTQLKALFEPA